MARLIPALKTGDLNLIHTATLQVLRKEGVVFRNPEAIALFKKHGFTINGSRVLMDETQVTSALKTVPDQFSLTARNPDKSLQIGTRSTCFVPGCGAPWISDTTGVRRKGTLADYDRFCQLVQTSDVIDANGFLLVDISDRPVGSAHLHMLYSHLHLCGKPFMGFPGTRRATRDTLAMARLVWGDPLPPVMMMLVNGMAPMQFCDEMTHAVMAFAAAGQPLIITGGGIMGATAPIQLPGLLVVQNAAILAAVTLSQLVRPGAAVVYGATGTTMDMRTGAYETARPEFSLAAGLGAQVAQFYGIPCRGGGAVSDAHIPDIQAGMESALTLSASIDSGINIILLACGMLGSLMTMSFEKFIIDEALCGMVRHMTTPVEISEETIDLASILEVGAAGNYITHSQTLRRCRTAFYPSDLIRSKEYDAWRKSGSPGLTDAAANLLTQRLERFEPPDMDEYTRKALKEYIDTHQ
jgi:trimethylamine--corrinoid protein Co-methyltransferase